MCKLAAMVNLDDTASALVMGKVSKIMTHLLYMNSFKNDDGTGVVAMTKDGSTWGHKRAIPSTDFVNTKWYQGFEKQIDKQRFVAMHTRYSTVGGNSDRNSHPFVYGDYVLMQNGTARVHKNLVKGKISPCEVDSESVCWSMAEQGIDATFDNYEGAGVFMFMDKKNKTFNIVKNDERELNIAKVKGHDIFIIATEVGSLLYAFSRAGLEMENWYPEEVENDLLHTYSLDKVYTNRRLVVKPPFYSYNKGYHTPKKSYSPPSKTSSQSSVPANTGSATSTGKSSDYQTESEQFGSPFEDDDIGVFVAKDCCMCGDVIDETFKFYRVANYENTFCCHSCSATAKQCQLILI